MKLSPDIFDDTATAYSDKSDGDLQKMKALFQLMNNNALVSLGSSVASFALSLHLPVSPLFKWTVYNHFCGGETFDECKKTIQQLQKSNVGVLLNYGVELKEVEEDFDKTVAKNIEALEFSGENKSVKGLCIKLTGMGRFGLFEKIQRLEKRVFRGSEQCVWARKLTCGVHCSHKQPVIPAHDRESNSK